MSDAKDQAMTQTCGRWAAHEAGLQAARPTKVEVRHLSLWYGDSRALDDISLRFGEREVTALIGPSGCGKSTLLRCLNRMNDLIPGVRIGGDLVARAFLK